MERKILFCNIAWMKYYAGVSEDDQPINGGEYIEKEATADEVNNFLANNGKCYGFVRVDGRIALEDHYKGVKASDDYVDDVLVIWLATNNEQKTKIVAWYKNARVYREDRDLTFFTHPQANAYYNIEAKAEDCFLLAEEDRVFRIDRANEAGKGIDFGQSNIGYADSNYAKENIVPELIKYIEDYSGSYANIVYDSVDFEKEIQQIDFSDNFERLYEEGIKKQGEKDYYNALVYFKAAQKIDEPVELLKKLAETLTSTLRYDETIEVINKIIAHEGETILSLALLRSSYDFKRDREKTIECSKRIIDFPSESEDYTEEKIYSHLVIFDIHVYNRDFEKAEETIKIFEVFLKNVAKYSQEDIDIIINPIKDYLKNILVK